MEDNTKNNQSQQDLQGVVSPDQLSLFSEATPEVTRLDIPHQVLLEQDTIVHDEDLEELATENDEVSGAKKIKIIAALAIVAVAGYIAYWVQEPVQIKADVIGTEAMSEPVTDTVSDAETDSALSDDLSADNAMEKATSPSVNVDVSLFGFEPSTLKLDKGTTVVWTNTSTEDQTIVGSSEDGQSFVSPVLTSGDSFNYQFDQDSTFQYYSTYNPALKASIIVGLGVLSEDALESTTSPVSESPDSEITDSEATSASTTSGPMSGTALEDAINQTQALSTTAVSESTDMDSSEPEDLKPAADSPTKLAKTGPEDFLYLVLILGLGWFQRKTLLKVFKRY